MTNTARKIQTMETETERKRDFKVVDGKEERKITTEELMVSLTQKFLGISIVALAAFLCWWGRTDLRAWLICLPMFLFGLKLITTKKWWLYGERI